MLVEEVELSGSLKRRRLGDELEPRLFGLFIPLPSSLRSDFSFGKFGTRR